MQPLPPSQRPRNLHRRAQLQLRYPRGDPSARRRRRSRTAATLTADDEVAAEEPAGDQRLFGRARRPRHDVQVRRVEAQSRSGKTVGDKVDPQQLDRDQRLGHAQCSRQEDTEDRLHNQ